MKICRYLTIFLILLFISKTAAFGQEPIEDENWLKGFKSEADSLPILVYWDFKRFSIKDIPQAKKRLNIIREFAPKTEWEGLYYSNTGIGDSKFIWNTEGGFFNFYFYHTLKYFYFGEIKDFSGYIELNPEKLSFSQENKKSVSKSKLVKVKIGERRFLVPENRLNDFCKRAVGLSTSLSDFGYYWIKQEDMHKKSFGLPILSAEYKKYLRYSIEAQIIHVGKRKIIPNEQSTDEYNYDDIHYPITINIGRNKKLQKDMNFFVEDLGEWIQITKVYQESAVGVIRRDFDENNQEQCLDSEGGSGQIILCKEIKVGMTAKTKGDL